MAGALATAAVKDGAGNLIAGGLRLLDVSGAGTGPHLWLHGLVDGVDGANRAAVDGNNRLQVQVGGSDATLSIGKAEDLASGDGHVGVPAMAVRASTPANTSGANGDYEFVRMLDGRVWIRDDRPLSGKGTKAVAVAGTSEALAGSTPCQWVTIQARATNTNAIAVGTAGVLATLTTGDGILLYAGESITIPASNLANVHIDALVSGEGVRFIYGNYT